MLVDACEAGEAVAGAGVRWPEMLAVDGRFELLVASGDHNAYDGCFTRTLLEMFAAGLPNAGSQLLCGDLVDALAQRCPRQIPHHTSYTRGSPVRPTVGDRGLWLVPNQALDRHAVTGHAMAGFVDQLTTGVLITASVRDALQAVLDARDVTRALRRCGRRVTLVVDGIDQPEPGARGIIVTALQELTTEHPDRPPVYVVAGMRAGADLGDVAELGHAVRIQLAPPTSAELRQALAATGIRATPIPDGALGAIAGGWLVARLLNEVSVTPDHDMLAGPAALTSLIRAKLEIVERRCGHPGAVPVTLRLLLLLAAGVGPIMPITVLASALGTLGHDLSFSRLRDILVDLGALISRGRPGQATETVGIIHAEFASALSDVLASADPDAVAIHAAIIDALGVLSGAADPARAATVYAQSSLPRHLLAVGNSAAALAAVASNDCEHAADNQQRWAAWIPEFETVLGADHPDTLRMRAGHARWLAESGHFADAAALLEDLVTAHARALGPDHPDTLDIRGELARCRGSSGNAGAAVAELSTLVDDRIRVHGQDHAGTFATMRDLAEWRGRSGDFAGAFADLDRLLGIRLRVLHPLHPDILSLRGAVASLHGKHGDVDVAVREFTGLLADRTTSLGPDHPDTLTTRSDLAYWLARAGDVDAAIAHYRPLLEERLRVLGADHADTLRTRASLAFWQGASGNPHEAVAEYREQVTERGRILGPDHPKTLLAHENLAAWRGLAGDIDAAVAEYENLYARRRRLLGPDHPDTRQTGRGLMFWRDQR